MNDSQELAWAPVPVIKVFGSLNMDLVSYVPHHPLPGETLRATSFSESTGGKGANQAVACAKLSRTLKFLRGRGQHDGTKADLDLRPEDYPCAEVKMYGAVGDDKHGDQLNEVVSSYGVDFQVVRRADLKTGVAIIVVDEPTGENRIILNPGANDEVFLDDMEVDEAGNMAYRTHDSHFPSLWSPLPSLIIMQLEIPLKTVLAALRRARAENVPVLLNPAPATSELPAEVMRGLAHLVLNETEAALLTGCDVNDLTELEGVERAATRLVIEWGVENVVITLGARGAYFMSSSGGQVKKGAVPAENVAAVVDTTAAGDTFVGQYALEVVQGAREGHFDIEAALKKASKAAAKTVQKKGAQESIPWRDEVDMDLPIGQWGASLG